MRDALSLLDQCIAFYLGEPLTYDHVLEVLGAVDTEVFSRLLRSILANNVVQAIELLEELIVQGRELGQFVTFFWSKAPTRWKMCWTCPVKIWHY